MKIQEVIDKILAYHPQFPEDYAGCDEFKTGDPQEECTGVVTAMAASVAVIRKAIELGANLIVVHEPTFYTSEDKGGWYETFSNEVYEEKRKLIDENHIAIWRDHDHMHAHHPDAIFTGVLRYLDWEDKALTDYDTGSFAHYYVTVTPMKLKDLCQYLFERIGMNGCRIIGDPDAVVSKIAIVGHLFPGEYKLADGTTGEYSVKVIETLEKGTDVIIPGEVVDWTVLSYIRDANELGKNKAMINLGHFNWEELGMKYMKDWLSELVEYKVPVYYVAPGDMYQVIERN
jgi:putative NIF3 family GTP cyclohydrolase 1 type 2